LTMEAAINQTNRFQKQFRYHHGNLRETLVEAALDILANEGIEALSLRSIARKSDVSQAAPYSHFKSKKDLISTVAEAGFQKLALKMADDASGAYDVNNRINKLVLSYINFAKENKPLFKLMFSNDVADIKDNATLNITSSKTYSLISAALLNGEEKDVSFLAVALWSFCHGLTNLLIDEKLDIKTFGANSLEDFVAKSVDTFSPKF